MKTSPDKNQFGGNDFNAKNFGNLIDKVLADNTIDKQEAEAILESYNKNRTQILQYSKAQLSSLQDALGISHTNKLFANREIHALKKKTLGNDLSPSQEDKEKLKSQSDVPEVEAKLQENIETQKDKRYIRLWATDNVINLLPLNKGDKPIKFKNSDKAVVEYIGDNIGPKRRKVIVNGKEYSVFYTSFVETEENLTNVTPDIFSKLAKKYEGRKYDSTRGNGSDQDGMAPTDRHGNWQVSYHDGVSDVTDEKPLVCADLIRETLIASGLRLSFLDKAQKSSFDLRRVRNLEKLIPNEPGFFSEKIDSNTSYSVGDILTATNPKNGSRHTGIVTEVGGNGEPLKIIHSSYSNHGVVETDLSTFTKHGKYNLDNRIYFIPETYHLAMQKRDKQNKMA